MEVSIKTSRLEVLRSRMHESGVEWLWIEPSAGFLYLTGKEPLAMERLLGLLVSVSGKDIVFANSMFEEELASLGIDLELWSDSTGPDTAVARVLRDVRRLHVQGSLPASALMALRREVDELELEPGILASLRRCKDEDEIARLRHSGEVADEIVEWVAASSMAGLTEGRLAGAIKARYLERGANDSVALVASGANASKAHYLGDDAIAPRQPLLVDTGCAIDGYWSDTTRMFFPDRLEPDADRADEAVCSAYEAAFDRVAPGVPAQEIDRAARRVITGAGLGDYFHHRTGHGVGLEIHEVPYIREGNVEPLEVGNVFSIEPGIYVAGRFGLRYENLVFVSEQGAQPLNRTPRRHALLA